jgi:hypothetical protein
MTCARSAVLVGAAVLAITVVLPGQAMSQEAGIAETPDVAVGPADPGEGALSPASAGSIDGLETNPLSIRHYGTGRTVTYRIGDLRGLRSGYLNRCDPNDAFLGDRRSLFYSTGTGSTCTARDARYGWDGDAGGGGGRPNPGSPTSYTYPDTRFNLAEVLDDYRVNRVERQASNPVSSGGVAPQRIDPGQLEPRLEYATRSAAAERTTIPDVMEPLAAKTTSQAKYLRVRTAPVVTRQIMEQQIRERHIREAQRTNDGSRRDASERSERSATPRSAMKRAARTRPAAAQPRSATSARTSSPSSAPARSRPKSSGSSSTKTRPQS